MLMPMMFVRIVRMCVAQRRVSMPVRMRFCARRRIVVVLMVRIVDMSMIVDQRRMCVHVIVMLAEVQPETDAHQGSGANQLNCERLAEEADGDQCAHERRDGKV